MIFRRDFKKLINNSKHVKISYKQKFLLNSSRREIIKQFKIFCEFNDSKIENDLRILTIHIRSGDIFKGKVHPSYGQPPLCYYKEAINHYKPDSVELVYENDVNPTIPALINHLESKSIKYNTFSSKNLRDDINVLLRAKALVVGIGTFAKGIITLSDNVETFYSFQVRFVGPFVSSESTKLYPKGIMIYDKKGLYKTKILSRNWRNSLEQRNLMLQYDAENLSIEAYRRL